MFEMWLYETLLIFAQFGMN